jgi:hypothetical protein
LTLPTTVIRKVRRPEDKGICRWPAYVMSNDHHGQWLYSPKGTIHRFQVGSKIVRECEVGQGDAEAGHPVMHLVPHGAWWFAAWSWVGEIGISVDICTPPTLIDDEWSYIDLELDPFAFFDGHVEIDDEDEFVAACEEGLISHNEAVEARATATEVEQYLRDHTEPFGLIGWNKLDEAISLSLPPIRELRHVPTA